MDDNATTDNFSTTSPPCASDAGQAVEAACTFWIQGIVLTAVGCFGTLGNLVRYAVTMLATVITKVERLRTRGKGSQQLIAHATNIQRMCTVYCTIVML